jgi:flagellar assembly protein FliH
MPCKIADTSITVQPVNWASPIAGTRRENPLVAGSAGALPPANPSALKEEVERAVQAQIGQAQRNAFEEGKKTGRTEAMTEIQAANDRLSQTLRDLVNMKRRVRSEAEADIVKLSLAVARRILYRELAVDPESIQGIVHAALQKLQNRQITTIRMSPASSEGVKAALEKAGASGMITLTPDARMRSGDLIFETALGDLDASVETQLQEIERGFSDRLGLS